MRLEKDGLKIERENFFKSIGRPRPKEKDGFIKRYNLIHIVIKRWILYPVLKVLYKILNKYVINSLDDIPKEKHNNHQRIFYNAWETSLKKAWTLMEYYIPDRECKEGRWKSGKWKDANECYDKHQSKLWNHKLRMLAINVWMTEILEDSFDREWINFFMLDMYHSMDEHYKGKVPKSGEYPIFKSKEHRDPVYFHNIDENYELWEDKKGDKDGK